MSQINRKVAITRIFLNTNVFRRYANHQDQNTNQNTYLFGLAFQTPAQVLKYAAVLVGVSEFYLITLQPFI